MSALHFYQNRQMELFAAKETKRLTLRQLVSVPVLCNWRLANDCISFVVQIFFGRSMNEERLVKVLIKHPTPCTTLIT